MKFYIVKHYWKNGESATWQKHDNVDNELFEYLKNNYHNFVKSRKSKDKFKSYNIHLCYEDKKDIYNRDITNITFFISKSKIPLDICNKEYNNLEIDIQDNHNKKFIVIIVATLFLSLAVFYNIFRTSDNIQQTKKVATIVHISKSEPKNKYIALVENYWNPIFEDIKKNIKVENMDKYRIDKDMNNTEIMEKLDKLMKPFYYTEEERKKYIKSLTDKENNPDSILAINLYKQFLKENFLKEKYSFKENIEIGYTALKKKLKELIKTDNMEKAIKKILMMNDKNIYSYYKVKETKE